MFKICYSQVNVKGKSKFSIKNFAINEKSSLIPNILYEYYAKGELDDILYIKRLKLDLKSRDEYGNNLLHIAAFRFDLECMRNLKEHEKSLKELDELNVFGNSVLDIVWHDPNATATTSPSTSPPTSPTSPTSAAAMASAKAAIIAELNNNLMMVAASKAIRNSASVPAPTASASSISSPQPVPKAIATFKNTSNSSISSLAALRVQSQSNIQQQQQQQQQTNSNRGVNFDDFNPYMYPMQAQLNDEDKLTVKRDITTFLIENGFSKIKEENYLNLMNDEVIKHILKIRRPQQMQENALEQASTLSFNSIQQSPKLDPKSVPYFS